MKDELIELTKDAAEYVSYLRELGVNGVEDSSALLPVAASAEKPRAEAARVAESPALQRNARAAVTPELPPKSAPTPEPPARVAYSTPEQTDMAKRTTKRTPELEPPPPQETLFGEITPKDEASLPQANETLEDIWNDIGECTRCPLAAGRTHIVNSEGNRRARLMFVGEAPGADEDASARPFVGRAGQLLNKIIEAIGLKREDVMIGNVNRCRPPQNRTPTLEEAKTCKPFLLREIAVVRPDVIVVLGNTAMKNLLDTKEGITRLRGKFQDYKGIKVMPTFHPAYLLRDPSKKREAWEDMKTVRDYLNSVKSDK
ncbi:MAG TPA: uracil-DNA glycosylase family protein [Pyrinomonadaceae bacterium]|nr:uracil-DNA glycosylase family protein [Pyrinomonadaceae bacterium]